MKYNREQLVSKRDLAIKRATKFAEIARGLYKTDTYSMRAITLLGIEQTQIARAYNDKINSIKSLNEEVVELELNLTTMKGGE